MPTATLVGKDETFKALGLRSNQRVELESLMKRLRAKFEQEYYDCGDVGESIVDGLKDVRDGKIDNRPWRQVLDEI